MCLLQDHDIDIAIVTETWLSDQANTTTAVIKSYGYNIVHDFRADNRGGGTALIYNMALHFSVVNLNVQNLTTFEFIAGSVKCTPDMKILVLCIYRTGPVSKKFFEELDDLLGSASLKSDYILIGGDFNIHTESITVNSTELLQTTSSYGFKQLIENPTHMSGGTIDLLFDQSNLIESSTIEILNNCTLSDHFPIIFATKKFQTNLKAPKTITTRKLKTVDCDQLAIDLLMCSSDYELADCFVESCENFFQCVGSVLDEHAPLVQKTISFVPHAPWFDSEYKDQRKLRRKAERNKHKSEENRILFEEIRNETTNMANLKKQQYYKGLLDKNKHDVKAIYSIVNRELDRHQNTPLPESEDVSKLCSDFNHYFNEKIKNIRKNFPSIEEFDVDKHIRNQQNNSNFQDHLDEFEPCTEEELSEIIKESGIKCAPSDFLPTAILKDNITNFIPVLCKLVNQSLAKGTFEGLKTADIIPTIKDHKLDPNDFKSYRPISNLSFLGKLIERVVLKRLNDHLVKNDLNVPQQSAYKKFHSTETILLKVTNDLLLACDSKSSTVLMMLDLSAAFDTVEHRKLLKILSEEIHIGGTALKWFKSFLVGRTQRTRIGSTTSDTIILEFGVPQGSVLGPVLFNIYIRSLYRTIEKSGFNVQGYADDHQVYKTFKPCDQVNVLGIQIVNCARTIQHWMVEYCLQLNPGKTQILIIASPQVLNQLSIGGVKLSNDTCIRFVSTAKNLGVQIDHHLSFEPQIMSLKKHCFRLLRNVIGRKYLFSKAQLKLIINSIIVCKLDYCNALYYGISDNLIHQLQLVQNAAAKAIVGLYKYDHLGDTMKDLHWLPISYRIQYKILLLVYKCLNGMGPDYLSNMFHYANYNHLIYLTEPRVYTHYGERSFQKVGPKLWNELPLEIKNCMSLDSFKVYLKTFLFKRAYDIN